MIDVSKNTTQPSSSAATAVTVKHSQPRRRLHVSTYVVLLFTATFLFFANVPGQYVTYIGSPPLKHINFDYKGLAWNQLEHGWPLSYLVRENSYLIRPDETDWRETKIWSFIDDFVSFQAWPLVADCFAAIGVLAVVAFATEHWRRQRRYVWQLRMTDLLGLTAVCAMGTWYGLTTVREYDHEVAAMRKVSLPTDGDSEQSRSLNGSAFAYGGPIWLRDLKEDWYPPYLFRLIYASLPEIDIEELKGFSHLRAISVMEEPGPRLASLAQLEQLEAIGLYADSAFFGFKSEETLDRDFAHCLPSFAEMPNLTIFHVDGNGVGDRSANAIARFPRLRVLWLSSTRITDEGMRAIGQCETVEELYIDNSPISDVAMAHLQSLSNLRILYIRSCPLSDAAFDQISRLSTLQQLRLDEEAGGTMSIRGSGLQKLADLKELQFLLLPSTIDREAVADLQRRRPDLKITVEDDPFPGFGA